MGAHVWNPQLYGRYAGERGRPFVELLARVDAQRPRRVVDLGCGPGTLTALLARRWPEADVLGVDSSPAMIDAATGDPDLLAVPRLRFERADLRDWLADPASAGVDVLVSNATLQWLPDHLELLPRLVAALAPGGWLAVQVPGNFGEPSHTVRTALAAQARFAAYTRGVAVPASHEPRVYLAALAALGATADVWETTYLHVLHGPDPVRTWVLGTGARPTLQALPEGELREDFLAEFGRRLREAYPPEPDGTTVLPFRRIFAVAQLASV